MVLVADIHGRQRKIFAIAFIEDAAAGGKAGPGVHHGTAQIADGPFIAEMFKRMDEHALQLFAAIRLSQLTDPLCEKGQIGHRRDLIEHIGEQLLDLLHAADLFPRRGWIALDEEIA